MTRSFLLTCLAVMAAGIVFIGCGKSAATYDAQAKCFQDSPTLKASWDQGMTAFQAHDYAGATKTLLAMKAQTLTPEQLAAVDKAMTAVTEAMYTAASKGDEAAKKAIEDVKRIPRR
jgi:hypothetical protein